MRTEFLLLLRPKYIFRLFVVLFPYFFSTATYFGIHCFCVLHSASEEFSRHNTPEFLMRCEIIGKVQEIIAIIYGA